jgi:stage II sporulation protein D
VRAQLAETIEAHIRFLARARSCAALTVVVSMFVSCPTSAFASGLFLVKGAGWGNGVGMSQWGAEGYALHGWDYHRILAHYYPHTTIGVVAQRTVRVLIADKQPRISVGSASPYLIVDGAGRRIHLRPQNLTLTPRLRLGEALVPPVEIEAGAQPLTLDGKGYRGSFTVLRNDGRLSVVNTVPLERYLLGVVPEEMPRRWSIQAYAAQAVAARSYALATLKPGASFDLYADNRSQMYGGISSEQPETNLAVGSTTGQVLTYAGQIITAYYDSNSGGRTAAVQDVFAGFRPQPYLVSVSDPYDALSPFHRWRVAFSSSKLSARFGMQVDDVRVQHNGSGVTDQVTLLGPKAQKTMSGVEFSQALGLRSIRFSISVASLAEPPAHVRKGRRLRLHGFLRDLGGVVLQQRLLDGSWRQVLRVRARRDGRFEEWIRPRLGAAYRLAVDRAAGPAVEVSVER